MTQTRSGIYTSQLSCTLMDPYMYLYKLQAFETKSFTIKTAACLSQYLLFSYFAWKLHISRTDVVPSTHHASALGWMKILPINYNIILLNQNRAVITWLYLSQIVYSHNIFFFYHGRIKLKLSIHKQRHLLSLTTLMLQLSRQRKRPSMPDTSRYR